MNDYQFLDALMVLVNSGNDIDSETLDIIPDYLNDTEQLALKIFIDKLNTALNKD
jgi:hypothetical protein